MTKKKPEEGSRPGDAGAAGVDAIQKLAAQTGGPAPENQRIAALAVGVFGIIVVLIGMALALGGQPGWAVGVVAIGAVVVMAALVVALLTISKVMQQDHADSVNAAAKPAEPPRGRMRWYRLVVSQSEVTAQRFKLHEALQSLRRQAQQEYTSILTKRRPKPDEINVSHVRINAFLPDVEAGEENLQVCVLRIPDQLSDGMSDRAEREMTFWPGQGLTGLVFVSGRAFGAVWPGGDQEWRRVFVSGKPGMDESGEEIFHLTKEQISRISKALRWVIGFPLLASDEVVGVLNIDGLDVQLSEAEMGTLFSNLKPDVDRFADLFKPLIKCAVEVWVRELPNGRPAAVSTALS